MPNETERPSEKSLGGKLKERVEDFVQELVDALGSLVAPQPELVPIPVRGRPRPHRR